MPRSTRSLAYGDGRRSWLAFCSGVEHATHVAAALRERGVSCATIFGDTPSAERDRIIAAFKRGEIRALASMGVLTTGFNAPAVDLIAMLRPTKSTGLYVQMAGRGTRLAPGKDNCLVLDFAGNVARHGPIDAVKPIVEPRLREAGHPGRRGGAGADQGLPGLRQHRGRRRPGCARLRPRNSRRRSSRSTPPPPRSPSCRPSRPQWLEVSEVSYRRHDKPGKPPSMRVDYSCGLARHSEWVCFEHTGYARQKAVAWWQQRSAAPVPRTVSRGAGRGRQPGDADRHIGAAERPLHRDRQLQVRPMHDLASAPSVAASPAASAGSMRAIASATPGATPAAPASAPASARTSAIGGRGMIDPTPNERAAMLHGAEMAGEYLDSLGKTDLAPLERRGVAHPDRGRSSPAIATTCASSPARTASRLDAMTPEVPF